jgi:WD40 repeat protein
MLWDAQTGQNLGTFQGVANSVYSVAFNSDGKHVLTSSYDGTTRLEDIASGNKLARLLLADRYNLATM